MGKQTVRERLAKQKVKFVKRKRGILKKSMEISLKCDKNVFMVIHDPVTKET